MIILRNIRNIFAIPELMRKITFTLFVLIVYRIGSFIPVIGVNIGMLAEYMSNSETLGQFFNILDTFSGGNIINCTLFSLGIMPYITASIMMQILTVSVPYLEALQKEGNYGQKMINQYTRYLTIALSIFYSTIYAGYLIANGLALHAGVGFYFLFVLSLTTGSVVTMWLGEQISLMGIGNGSSMIIFANIIARFPGYVVQTTEAVQSGQMPLINALLVLAIFVAITAAIVFIEKGDRRIPVQYARRVVGQKVYGAQTSYIPFKINTAGVMPVIFASQFLIIPTFIVKMISKYVPALSMVTDFLNPAGYAYQLLLFCMIFFFTYFYTSIFFNPEDLAQQMKKNGGFVPGIRPGKRTADYFQYILNRLGTVGSLYLGFLSLIPTLLLQTLSTPFFLGGTSLLIVVGVALEFSSQLESYLIDHRYDGFLKRGSMRRRTV